MPQVHKRKTALIRGSLLSSLPQNSPLSPCICQPASVSLHLAASRAPTCCKRGTCHLAKRPLFESWELLEVSSARLQSCHLKLVQGCLKSGSCQSRASYQAAVIYRALRAIYRQYRQLPSTCHLELSQKRQLSSRAPATHPHVRQLLHITSQAHCKTRQEAAACEQEQGEERGKCEREKREESERKSKCDPCDRSLLPR
jgi:hypothetical protein